MAFRSQAEQCLYISHYVPQGVVVMRPLTTHLFMGWAGQSYAFRTERKSKQNFHLIGFYPFQERDLILGVTFL